MFIFTDVIKMKLFKFDGYYFPVVWKLNMSTYVYVLINVNIDLWTNPNDENIYQYEL